MPPDDSDFIDETPSDAPANDGPAPAAPPAAPPAATREVPPDEPATEAPSAPPSKPKKKSRIGDVIIVVVLLAVALGAVYYWAEVRSAIQLQVWSKGAPKQVMKEIGDAFAANDMTVLRRYFREGAYDIGQDGTTVTTIHPPEAAMMPPMPVSDIAPAGEPVSIKTVIAAKREGIVIKVPTPSGGAAEYKLRKDVQGWYVHSVGVSSIGD